MSQTYDSSQQLLGGYLHQDWPSEFDSADAAIAAIIDGEPAETRRAAAGELRSLVSSESDDAALRRTLIDRIGCYYEPASEGKSDREWLASLADRLAA